MSHIVKIRKTVICKNLIIVLDYPLLYIKIKQKFVKTLDFFVKCLYNVKKKRRKDENK